MLTTINVLVSTTITAFVDTPREHVNDFFAVFLRLNIQFNNFLDREHCKLHRVIKLFYDR